MLIKLESLGLVLRKSLVAFQEFQCLARVGVSSGEWRVRSESEARSRGTGGDGSAEK